MSLMESTSKRVNITTPKYAWKKLLATNTTLTAGLSCPAPAARPTSVGGALITLDQANSLILLPFGAGADTGTIVINVYLWSPVVNTDGSSGGIFYPHLSCVLACVLGTRAGIANTAVIDTDLAVKTITATYDGSLGADLIVNAGGGVAATEPAPCAIDTTGATHASVLFDVGTATNANCLWRVI